MTASPPVLQGRGAHNCDILSIYSSKMVDTGLSSCYDSARSSAGAGGIEGLACGADALTEEAEACGPNQPYFSVFRLRALAC